MSRAAILEQQAPAALCRGHNPESSAGPSARAISTAFLREVLCDVFFAVARSDGRQKKKPPREIIENRCARSRSIGSPIPMHA